MPRPLLVFGSAPALIGLLLAVSCGRAADRRADNPWAEDDAGAQASEAQTAAPSENAAPPPAFPELEKLVDNMAFEALLFEAVALRDAPPEDAAQAQALGALLARGAQRAVTAGEVLRAVDLFKCALAIAPQKGDIAAEGAIALDRAGEPRAAWQLARLGLRHHPLAPRLLWVGVRSAASLEDWLTAHAYLERLLALPGELPGGIRAEALVLAPKIRKAARPLLQRLGQARPKPPSKVPGAGAQGGVDLTLARLRVESMEVEDARRRVQNGRGDVVLLHVYATWCGACRASYPTINAAARDYREKGLRALVAALDQHVEPVRRYLVGRRPEFDPLWLRPAQDGQLRSTIARLGGRYRNAVPYTALFDRRGRLQFEHTGGLNKRRLRGKIEALLAE